MVTEAVMSLALKNNALTALGHSFNSIIWQHEAASEKSITMTDEPCFGKYYLFNLIPKVFKK